MQERLFYISELIGKELNGTIDVEEATALQEWVNNSVSNKVLFEQLHNEAFVKLQLEKFERYDAEKNRAYLMGKLEERAKEEAGSGESLVVSMKPKVQLWKRIAVAASIVGVLFFAGYWFLNSPSTTLTPTTDPSTIAQDQDVPAPDKNRAQIKLADGTIVYLDSAGNGELVNVNGVVVKKTEDGRIEYNGQLATGNEQVIYNTLMNPRGSKVIDMKLADGSRVWLNAGSSVTYPVAFVGNERKVSITGEAYFEVVHNAKKPFKVGKGDMEVTVLGTHFNVNAYDDESDIRVTLLEGSVNVSTKYDVRGKKIKPGQQAVSNVNPSTGAQSELSIVSGVDTEQVMAWKNGYFSFDKTDLQVVMRQISRWYDVEVLYEGKIPDMKFGGDISRSSNVSQVLKILEESKVHFRIEGKKIVVMP